MPLTSADLLPFGFRAVRHGGREASLATSGQVTPFPTPS